MKCGRRTLMLGWEFPPFISGGLGTACYGLTRAMDRMGMKLTFLLPGARTIRLGEGQFEALSHLDEKELFRNISFYTIKSGLSPYLKAQPGGGGTTAGETAECGRPAGKPQISKAGRTGGFYGPDIFSAVSDYADTAAEIADTEDFKLTHAHDWMTYPAASLIKSRKNRPLIVHVHSTEFDRSGENVNQQVYNIERDGMHTADRIITVSNYTRDIVVRRYGVAPEKIDVVYNGVELDELPPDCSLPEPDPAKRTVLFLGRVTMQKGPEYFIHAAKKVSEKVENARFIMAGDGDMLYRCINLAADMKIGHKVFFTRFLRGSDVHKAYRMSDLYVMPSVSEPFGIVPLEAMRHGVPVIISRQSGISERLTNALKVDFWDVDEMANKIASVLRYPALKSHLSSSGSKDVFRFRWDDAAVQIKEIYNRFMKSA